MGSDWVRLLEWRMISSSAAWIARARTVPLPTSLTSVSRASALATSPLSCPPMPSATSHNPSSGSA
jgi:hypothetical protein